MKNDIATYVGCIAGAIVLEEYHSLFRDASFSSNFRISISISWKILTPPLQDVIFHETKSDLNVYYVSGQDPATSPGTPSPRGIATQKPTYDFNEWIGESLL